MLLFFQCIAKGKIQQWGACPCQCPLPASAPAIVVHMRNHPALVVLAMRWWNHRGYLWEVQDFYSLLVLPV